VDIEVNYKNKKRYKTSRYPLHQTKFWTSVIWILSRIALLGKDFKVKKVNMDGVKPPYMILSNHMHFVDFELAAMATWPHPVSNVVTIDGYVAKSFLLEWIGSIATRRFTMDLPLIRSIKKVLQRGDVLTMYPEARYSPCGKTSYIPESLGKLVKKNKVPIVVALHHGNYLYAPFWNFRKKRSVPLRTTLTYTLSTEQIEKMSVEEINEVLHKALDYDEYRYQKENGILIKEPYRAEGLHKILYKCPHCNAENMDSEGAELFCKECSRRWYLNEDGSLQALEGETEFSHVPTWFEWEREQVRKEIEEGSYYFEDEVEVYSLPRVWSYLPLGKAKLVHDPEKGFILDGVYRGERYHIHRTPIQTSGLHIEYDFGPLKKKDYVDISTENDSFYCGPSQRNIITKLSFATEELYRLAKEKEPTV